MPQYTIVPTEFNEMPVENLLRGMIDNAASAVGVTIDGVEYELRLKRTRCGADTSVAHEKEAENKNLLTALRELRTAMDNNPRMTERQVKVALDVLLTAIVRQPKSVDCAWSRHIKCLDPSTCGCTCHTPEAIERANRAYAPKPQTGCPCAQCRHS